MSVYANHAGTSWPKPAPVVEAAAEALSADPVDWPRRFEAAHRDVARFFGVSDPSRLLLTPGCTSALQLAVSDLPWRAGDRVLLSGFEHAALERPVAALRTRGVRPQVVRSGPPADGGALLDPSHLEAALRGGDVRAVAVSSAANTTGDVADLPTIIDLARAHDARVIVDAAQTAGWIDLDLEALGADVVAFGGHKGLQGTWGIGGLYAAPGVHTASPRLFGEGGPAGYCDGGSVDRVALQALAAAVAWLGEPARRGRLVRARGLVARLEAGLRDLPARGLAARALQPSERRMPTLALAGSLEALTAARDRLDRAGIAYGAGLQCAPLAHRTLGTFPQGTLRFSFGPGSTDADVDAVLEALA